MYSDFEIMSKVEEQNKLWEKKKKKENQKYEINLEVKTVTSTFY